MKTKSKIEKYYLMHGDVQCAIFTLKDLYVIKFEVLDEEHLPLSFRNRNISKGSL